MADGAAAPAPRVPPDQEQRDRITGELASTLFVEAGAGSGKTRALVTRVLALVASGEAELAEIAAITFTEKAAAELRDRVRRDLEHAVAMRPEGEAADRYRAALDQLDGAAIGTLHSFAQRILSDHPVEAGLPPKVEVVDEVNSQVAFERRWAAFRDQVLADPDVERTVQLLTAAGVDFEALRMVAAAFNDNWDLVEDRVPAAAPEPRPVHEALERALTHMERICAEPCSDPEDALRVFCDNIADYVADLRRIADELDVLEALDPDGPAEPPGMKPGHKGKQGSWSTDVKQLRSDVKEAGEALAEVRTTVANECVVQLGTLLRSFTLEAADERRRAGRLEFHDLLVRARSLLRDPEHGAAVRTDLHRRYRRLLLDEFQDTDPIQIELAVLIAADPGDGRAGSRRWEEVDVVPGRLFFVGDPKQSIYRFRRADIKMFLSAAERFGGVGRGRGRGGGRGRGSGTRQAQDGAGGKVGLTANFRTAAPVIDWVNTTFGTLIAGGVADSQPAYAALVAERPAPPVGPPVAVVGPSAHKEGRADDVRQAEAADVATAVARVVREEWSVDDGRGGWRSARLGDVTILLPARTSLPFLEDALDRVGIPYRAESSSLVYSSRAVRDVLMVLRAVADPTNALFVVSALRTPLFACGDDDLFRFHQRRRSWSYLAPDLDEAEGLVGEATEGADPVRAGLVYLRSLYHRRHWLAPSELLDRVVRDRRAMELGFAEGRPRDVWRRLRFVIDQARAWNEATAGNLREYVSWVDLQTAEGARVAEAVLPETDDDAVRIMTIHGAKGLEFPVTVVSGMSTAPRRRPARAEVVFPPSGHVGYRVGRVARTTEYDEWAPIDELMSAHERIRLLYVACTRARDHLVVSLHRTERSGQPTPENRTNAELLVDGMGASEAALPDVGREAEHMEVPAAAPPPPLPPHDRWQAELETALVRAGRATTVSASSLTDEGEPDVEGEPAFDVEPAVAGLQKGPRDLDLPPWLKGRYGTAVGRAVHGVLQTVDLASGAGLDAAVAAQCEAEAIVERAVRVRQLAADALGSPSVGQAAQSPHWREVYVCAPVGERQLEGYIDLLYRSPEGLVVVDYKTASTSDPAQLAARVEGYRVQGASYARIVAASTGEAVVRVTFVFLTPSGARELDLPDLDAAVREVGDLVVR